VTDEAYVVDTSVFVRWYVTQPGFEHARRVLDSFLAAELVLETVDFARVELANVLRKKAFLPGLCNMTEYVEWSRIVDDLGVVIHATAVDDLERAARLSAMRSLSTYDALFAHRALIRGIPLLTADARLYRALAGTVSTVLLDGSVPEALTN
jgi:predicted nucleic acid-binding protein